MSGGGEVLLAAEGLTKRFGTLTAVDGLHIDVRQGEVLGFLGPNGAGKTTSIRMLCGLLTPDAGEVRLAGERLTGALRHRRRVGLCPQQIVVWERLTCLEQLTFVGEMYELSAAAARSQGAGLLERLGLGHKASALARTLSGGMQRRLNIALALVHDPDLIVLDEPEAGLDPQSRVLVRDFIADLAKDKAVVLTTHNMDEADRVAGRVAIIDHGKVLCCDTPDALRREIGEGDVVQVDLPGGPLEDGTLARIAAAVEPFGASVSRGPVGLAMVGHRGAEALAPLLTVLAAAGVITGEVRLRRPTLEDVFLDLTGRRLRE